MPTPRLKGVKADVQRQIDRRLKKYERPPEELSIGRVTKKVSNIDWTELENNIVTLDTRKVAGKL